MPCLYWNIAYSYGRKMRKFKIAISPQLLKGFYKTKTKLYLETTSIVICGKEKKTCLMQLTDTT